MASALRRRALLLAALAAARPARADAPCCGPITPAGKALEAVLDGMDVEHRWLARQHVDWRTGLPDRAPDYSGRARATHCSAFAAAVGLQLGIYLLRPPEHGQELLASAQTAWLASPDAARQGWRPVDTVEEAQTLANQGEMVVLSYANPDPRRPGHIVVVRPSLKSAAELDAEGPQVIEAATRNRASYPAALAFAAHPGAWPDAVQAFAHALPSGAPDE